MSRAEPTASPAGQHPAACKDAICPGKPYPDGIRIRPPAIQLSVPRYIRPGGVRVTSSTADTKEVHGAPDAAAVHGTYLVLTQVCLHTLWPPIWRLHGGSTTANDERRLSSRSAAGPPQREP